MQAEQLFADPELRAYIRGQCRRHSKWVEIQEDFASAVWEWVCGLTVELDEATLKRQIYNVVHRAYRRELQERKLGAELAEAYEVDGRGPGSLVPAGRTGGEILLEERSLLQEVEPGSHPAALPDGAGARICG